jgi:hypothetical protein
MLEAAYVVVAMKNRQVYEQHKRLSDGHEIVSFFSSTKHMHIDRLIVKMYIAKVKMYVAIKM